MREERFRNAPSRPPSRETAPRLKVVREPFGAFGVEKHQTLPTKETECFGLQQAEAQHSGLLPRTQEEPNHQACPSVRAKLYSYPGSVSPQLDYSYNRTQRRAVDGYEQGGDRSPRNLWGIACHLLCQTASASPQPRPRSARRGRTSFEKRVRFLTVSSWLILPPWPIIRRCPNPPTWS